MGSLERRLRDLENASGAPPNEQEEYRRRGEVLRRMTDDELRRYDEALEAASERDPPQWRDEDLPILQRVEELTEEVSAEAIPPNVQKNPVHDRKEIEQ